MPIAKSLPVVIAALGLAAAPLPSARAEACCKTPSLPAGGSTSFCLYELPADEGGRRRWINLGIVQYVESGRDEVKIGYGGGRFGSGYEARIPVASAEEAVLQVERMRKAAAACR
jgi:hypothetical protein